VPLRIACDLDGTIADMEAALQREAERLFGPGVVVRPAGTSHLESPVDPPSPEATAPPSPEASARQAPPSLEASAREVAAKKSKPSAGRRALSDRQLRELWQHVATIENFWTTLSEIEPGSVARLAALRSAHNLEVIFLTQRPDTAGETTQLQTQRWLESHGFELPAVFVLRGSRGKAAGALHIDVVLDDRPENCLEVLTESKARPILVWGDPPNTVPPGAKRLGIETVFSIGEALRRVESLIIETPKTTFVKRLRNVIGI
jgi:hypothetical protein